LFHRNGIFSAANTAEFGTASSPNLDEIAVSVCQTLATTCAAPDTTLGLCSTAASDAIGVGDTAAAVDEFNSVLGIKVNIDSDSESKTQSFGKLTVSSCDRAISQVQLSPLVALPPLYVFLVLLRLDSLHISDS
jgi:hypothetical protein